MDKIKLKLKDISVGDTVFFTMRNFDNYHVYWKVIELDANGKIRVQTIGRETTEEVLIDFDKIEKHRSFDYVV